MRGSTQKLSSLEAAGIAAGYEGEAHLLPPGGSRSAGRSSDSTDVHKFVPWPWNCPVFFGVVQAPTLPLGT